jgi:hypothetical protein
MRHLKNSLLAAGLLSLILTGTAPAGYAQTSNTIYSCVTNNNGAIRIVSATTTCKSTEHLVIWSVTRGRIAPRGAARAQGPRSAARRVPVSGCVA